MLSQFYNTGLAFAGYNMDNEPINNSFRQCEGNICDQYLCEVVNMETFDHLIIKTSSLCEQSNILMNPTVIMITLTVMFTISFLLNIFLAVRNRRNKRNSYIIE